MEFITNKVRRMSLMEGENIKEELRIQLAVDENNMMGLEDIPVVDREDSMMPGLEGK